MRSFKIIALLFLCLVPNLFAQSALKRNTQSFNNGYYDFHPVSSATATEYVDARTTIFPTHNVDVVLGTGTNSVCTFTLQGSPDAVTWFDMSTAQSCTASLMFQVTLKPVRYFRINVSAYTGTAPLNFHYTGSL